jgi:hypothetical protein
MRRGQKFWWCLLAGMSLAVTVRGEDATFDASAPPESVVGRATADDTTSSTNPAAGELRFEASNCPGWTATAAALFLQRSTTIGPPLLLNPLGADLLDSSDLGFSTAVGPRLSLIGRTTSGWDFEVNYFGIDGWKATAEFPPAAIIGGLVLDQSLTLPVTDASFAYRSQVHSGELNIRRGFGDRLTALAGFRWVELQENYLTLGTEATYDKRFSHSVDTNNHLYGFQLGVDSTLFERNNLRINSVTKAGVFGNADSQSSSFSDPAGYGDFAASANSSHASFLGEISLEGSYQITKHAALRGGYQVMWIEGVALATRQIPATDLGTGAAAVNSTGGVFYHGATAGVEFVW